MQVVEQVMDGGVCPRHPNAQVMTSRHVNDVLQSPQSSGQLAHVSSGGTHLPSPHMTQTPQSAGHDAQVSLLSQTPSPHPLHAPQSSGQLKQFSVGSHTWSPQPGHSPQSGAHELHVSPLSHFPFGQPGHKPQSRGQEKQVSPSSHAPSPQDGGSTMSGGASNRMTSGSGPVSNGGGVVSVKGASKGATSEPDSKPPSSIMASSFSSRLLRPQAAAKSPQTRRTTKARVRKGRSVCTSESYQQTAHQAIRTSPTPCLPRRVRLARPTWTVPADNKSRAKHGL
jgi:hypothetical protein